VKLPFCSLDKYSRQWAISATLSIGNISIPLSGSLAFNIPLGVDIISNVLIVEVLLSGVLTITNITTKKVMLFTHNSGKVQFFNSFVDELEVVHRGSNDITAPNVREKAVVSISGDGNVLCKISPTCAFCSATAGTGNVKLL